MGEFEQKAMGKGKDGEFACGSRPIWIGVSCCCAVIGLATFVIGWALLAECSMARTDCEVDLTAPSGQSPCNALLKASGLGADDCYDKAEPEKACSDYPQKGTKLFCEF